MACFFVLFLVLGFEFVVNLFCFGERNSYFWGIRLEFLLNYKLTHYFC